MKKLLIAAMAAAGVFVVGTALADLTVKDANSVNRVIVNFVCQTTKFCNATTLIRSSDSSEIGSVATPLVVSVAQGGNTAVVKAANTVASTDVGVVVAVANTLVAGQAVMASSSPVVIASNQSAVPASQSGTWTVQPGNTANTTPWAVAATPLTLSNADFVSGTTAAMVGTTSTQLVPLVTSRRLYINRVKCNNTSSTATLVQIRDGSAGTVLDTLAAGATYGGEQGTGSTPLFWTTAGTALYAQNVTTGASVICTASGYSG